VVWKLDRLGRSLRHLVDTVTGLADRGIGLCSLQEAIDTTTPGGKLVFHVFAVLAGFDRDLVTSSGNGRGRLGLLALVRENWARRVVMAGVGGCCGWRVGRWSRC
jgi:hypothetical protein